MARLAPRFRRATAKLLPLLQCLLRTQCEQAHASIACAQSIGGSCDLLLTVLLVPAFVPQPAPENSPDFQSQVSTCAAVALTLDTPDLNGEPAANVPGNAAKGDRIIGIMPPPAPGALQSKLPLPELRLPTTGAAFHAWNEGRIGSKATTRVAPSRDRCTFNCGSTQASTDAEGVGYPGASDG